MILRPYQEQLYSDVRQAFYSHSRVFMCLPTGGGKTAIFSRMAETAKAKGRQVWICLPRQELIEQASESLSRIGVSHGRIVAGKEESSAFSLQIVSSNTMIRRWDRIKKKPDFVILDEAHLFYDRQQEICERFPEAKILGVSASPERLDGRGLSDIYGTLIEGPSIKDLTEMGWLCPVRYYAPPLDGLSAIKRKGLELDANGLAQLMETRKVYGQAVKTYKDLADGKTALIFSISVAESEKIAHEFRAAGYKFESVSGETPTKRRSEIIDALKTGQIHGVVNCEVATYGLDVPCIEYVALLRHTLSKAMQTQMIGRGLRPSPATGKEHCIIADHVNMIEEFGHPLTPYKWQFNGKEKRKRLADEKIRLKICPETFFYCEKSSCVGCDNNTKKRESRAAELVDLELKEKKAPVELSDRPIEEQAVFQNKIGSALDRIVKSDRSGNIDITAVKELCQLCDQIGRNVMWIYHRVSEGKFMVNVPLLSAIAQAKGYHRFWVVKKTEELSKLPKKASNKNSGFRLK